MLIPFQTRKKELILCPSIQHQIYTTVESQSGSLQQKCALVSVSNTWNSNSTKEILQIVQMSISYVCKCKKSSCVTKKHTTRGVACMLGDSQGKREGVTPYFVWGTWRFLLGASLSPPPLWTWRGTSPLPWKHDLPIALRFRQQKHCTLYYLLMCFHFSTLFCK